MDLCEIKYVFVYHVRSLLPELQPSKVSNVGISPQNAWGYIS